MKAIRVHQHGGPEVMVIEEIPRPEPGPGQILVRLHAAGVNPVDTYIRAGIYATKPPLPYTPGRDAAGVVAEVGEGVTTFKPQDRVYVGESLTGTYAEFALCLPTQVFNLPERISFTQGAGINIPYATAYRALFQKAKALPGESVLIHGATGGVGLAAVQLARSAGLRVIGTGGSAAGRALVLKQGADQVLDHHAPEYPLQFKSLTGGKGVDVILEMLANVNLGKDLSMLALGGRIAIIGNRGTVEINPREAMSRDAVILGIMLGNATACELASIHAALGAGLAQGTLNPIVGQEFPLADALLAHQAVMSTGALGKIILRI